MRPNVAAHVCKILKTTLIKLDNPLQLSDFRRKAAGLATHKLIADFHLDKKVFSQQEFIVAECGYDVFMGQKWLDNQDVWLHPRSRTFKWPDESKPKTKTTTPTLPTKEKNVRLQEIRNSTNWREPSPRTPPGDSSVTTVSMITTALEKDPRRERWENLPLPDQPVQLTDGQDHNDISRPPKQIATLHESAFKMRSKHNQVIDFPEGEDSTHMELVRKLIPKQIAHLEGFFSKQQAATLPPSRPGHDVVLELKAPLQGNPSRYPTPHHLLPLESETIDELLKIGFIERCMDPNAASTLFVPKPHSLTEKRFCVDYRWINKFLKDRIVPAPDLKGTIEMARNSTRFSKIDIIRAFNRLLIQAESRYLTAFRTRQGTFRWKVLPFGLKVGPAWWQEFINSQLHELLDSIASAYADDVLLFDSKDDTEEDHWTQVKEVICRLHDASLQGDIKKSKFNVQEVDYLGMIIRAREGIQIDPEKVKAILEWKFEDLTNITAVRSFLGLMNYVRVFCHHHSEAAEPLTRLLKSTSKSSIAAQMGSEQRKAFETLKKMATTAPVLAFFNPALPTRLECDASRHAVGGALMQLHEEYGWKPVGYFSKTMSPAERAYPIQDRELLGVVRSLEHFHAELAGVKFVVLTDHEALKYWSTKRALSSRQVRWHHLLSDYDLAFEYRKGSENVLADALSRKTAELPTVKARELEERTIELIPSRMISGGTDKPTGTGEMEVAAIEYDNLDDWNSSQSITDKIKVENEHLKLGRKDGKWIVPVSLRTELIQEAHEPKSLAHPGVNKTIQLLKGTFWWEGRDKDIRQYVRNCNACQRNKTRHDKTPGLLHPLPVPKSVWEDVAVDGKDMPKDRFGYDYVWRFVCRFSKLLATLPGKKTDTAEQLAARYYRSIYRFHGVPGSWHSDNGGQFISKFLREINHLTGTKHKFGSALHPQTQGAIEITNQELDEKLRFYINHHQDDWSSHLPALDFAHNATWHSTTGTSPLNLATGCKPRTHLTMDLPGTLGSSEPAARAKQLIEQIKAVQDTAREHALRAQEAQQKQANKHRRSVDFGVKDKVYLKKKGFATDRPTTRLDSQWAGPFEIVEERGFSFVLDLPDTFRGKNLFHADRLRRASQDPLPGQVQEPPPVEILDGSPEWEVDEVLASRLNRKKLEYKVHWKGCDPDETWYPARNFKNAATALFRFHKKYPGVAGPPVRLQAWLLAAAKDEFAEDNHDDDTPVKGRKTRTSIRRHT